MAGSTFPQTSWKGYYLDGQTARRHPVTVTVMALGLCIALEDGSSRWWPYREIRQTQGFHPGEPVRLEKGEGIAEVIVVSDAAFVTSLREIDPSTWPRFRTPSPRSRQVPVTILASIAVIVLGGTLYLWGLPALADWTANRVPVSWEEQLGEAVIAQLAPADDRCSDPKSTEAIHQIAARLVGSEGASPYQFSVIVVDNSAVNAFAVPGGQIVLFQGLLGKTESPEELAGVLAHEMEHVRQRHSVKAIFREVSIRVLISALTGNSPAESYGALTAEALGALRYRRRDEEEADREGMKRVQKATIDPMGMVHLFARLNEEASDVPRALEYISTHPATENRLEQLKRLAAQAHYTPIPLLPEDSWKQTRQVCLARP